MSMWVLHVELQYFENHDEIFDVGNPYNSLNVILFFFRIVEQ